MKRLLILLLVFMVAATFTVTATGGQEAPTKAIEREVIEYETISILWTDVVPEHPSLADEELLNRFGIKFNIEYLSRSAYKEKMNLLMATGEGIEVVANDGPGIAEIKQWASEGHLIPMSDYLEKIPNYRKLYDEDNTWDIMYALAKNADGKLYWLPRKRVVVEGNVWMYRKGIFDKLELPFPKTTDHVYNAFKKIKAEYPDTIQWPAYHIYSALGFRNAFRNHHDWSIDPDTDKLDYGPSNEKFRDVLKFTNRLYQEEMLEQEFSTMTKKQWTERYARGNAYLWMGAVNRVKWSNEIMKSVDPDANWVWVKDIVTGYPGKSGTTLVDIPIQFGGPFITRQCPDEKIERFLEYIDWSCTEEGILLSEFGIEGKTFKYEKGKPVFMENMWSFENPEGNLIGEYGFGNFMARNKEGYIHQYGSDVSFNVWQEVLKKADFYPIIAWELTKEQEKDLADIEPVMRDVWMEYATKFIMGSLDPSNDSHWNGYLKELKKVGIDKARAIREEAFKKSTLWEG